MDKRVERYKILGDGMGWHFMMNKRIDDDNAKSIGEAVISSMEGEEVSQYTFRKKDKAETMDLSKSKIQLGGLDYDQRSTLSYELSTFPLSTFGSDGLMRDPKPKADILAGCTKTSFCYESSKAS